MGFVTIAPGWEFDSSTREIFQHNGDPAIPTRGPFTILTSPISEDEKDLMAEIWVSKVRAWYIDPLRAVGSSGGKFILLGVLLYLAEGLQKINEAGVAPAGKNGSRATFTRAFSVAGQLHSLIKSDPLVDLQFAIWGMYRAFRCALAHDGVSQPRGPVFQDPRQTMHVCTVQTRVASSTEISSPIVFELLSGGTASVPPEYRLSVAPEQVLPEIDKWLDKTYARLLDRNETALRDFFSRSVFSWPSQ